MSGSMRTELSLGGLNGSNFASGYPNVDRPGSLRESLENRMVASGPSAAQYMVLEPFSMNELKNVRSGELRRVLGISVEESLVRSSQSRPFPPISWEELKRFRGSVEETSLRARDRAKSLQDSILKLDRFRNIISKKRQRSEIQSNNLNLLKIGSQMHQNPPDLLGQRLEERTKIGVPNKRARSSMAEARATSPYSLQPEGRNTLPGRQGITVEKDKSILIDKDKNMLRACNGVPMPTDDKARGLPVLPVGGDGWDKKMKRKRSLGTMVNRTSDGDRELKQAMQQRNGNEPSPRSSYGLGFRIGSANGITANNKMDVTSQLSAGSSRIIPRNELGNGSLSIDRRECSSGLDKELVTAKGNYKLNTCEDAQLGSQSPLTKGKGARAPRTSSSMVMNSPNFPRSSGGIDGWEQSSSVNKVQPLTGTSNRKQPFPTGSSSPPVARWGGQRREKISRTRRANVVSPVSNFDETQADSSVAPEIGARLSSMESNGALFNRGIQNNSHLNLKHENVPSPAALFESEESGAIENKSKEKGMDNSEVEDGTLNVAHRAATFVLPTKKNKAPLREEFGDGVRRQGRSGRGSIQSKASLQLRKEALESLETARSLKSGRLISDKTERSRIGRPPSKKAFDRKVSSRPLQIINSSTCESDDDQEELLAAAKAVQNASCLENSGPFWMLMEPIFASVSSEDISLVKHQINFAEELDGTFSDMLDADRDAMAKDTSQLVPSHISPQVCQTNLVGVDKSTETRCSVDGPQPVKPANGKIETERLFEKIIPLSQRLLSAFISDEETEMIDGNTKLGDALEDPSDCFPYGANSFVENEYGSEFTKFASDFDNDMGSQTNNYGDNTPCNGFASPSSTFRSPSNFISSDELLQENGHMIHPNDTNIGTLSDFEQDKSNEQEPKSTALSGTSPNQCQYEHMSLDDKILMELHSIGIYPDAVPGLAEGDDEIGNAILELKIRLYEQAKKKRSLFCKLEKALQERKECEMRNREQLAMDKLVEIAYKKLLGGRGSHGSSHKSGASKASKQFAMAFANRTLARVRKFEETGQSCFSEPFLRDVLFSEPVHGNDAKIIDGISSGIAPNMHVDLQNYQLGTPGSVAASGVYSNIIERHGSVHQIDRSQLDPYQSITSISEQAFVRNDQISNRGKKEVLLDDVVTGAASRAMSVVNGNLPGSTKWKKIDKDRNRDILTKNSAPKGGTGRGERKTKAKPKQKIAQLSSSGNGIGRVSETTSMLPSVPESCETVNTDSTKVTPEVEFPSSRRNAQDLSKDTEDNIFTNLPLRGIDSIDELDVTDGLGGQGEDIGSWLNVDDDALQDNDLVGLEIPMDDLSELKLNF